MRPTSDSIISTTGLTFLAARNRIQNVLGNVLEFFKEVQSKQSWNKVFQDKSFQLWIGIAAYQPGLIFTLIVFGILFLVNFICLIQSHRINQIELSTLIQSIIQQYQSYLAQQAKVLSDQNLNNFQAIQIPSGHSQVSIVHVYRHHQWMRIPVLLLAEGDIIALMGGDITPCQVYELKVVSVTLHHATTKKSSESELKWMKTKLITTGEKIYIDLEESATAAHDNNHQQHHHSRHRTTSHDNCDADDHDDLQDHDFDAPLHTHHRHKSNETHHHHQSASSSKKTHAENRHRSLGPESVEILRLCGNIRCFLVAETPIESYIHTIYSQQLAIAERNQQTFLFKLRDALIVEGSKILFIIAVIMIILAIIRLILFNECRLEYFLTFLIPVGNIILIATPINIPLIQLLLKSFSIAEILSTLEAALSYSDHSNRGNINSVNNNNIGVNSNLNSPNNTQPTRMSMNIVSAASPTQNSSNLRKESNSTFGSSIRNPVHHEPVASEEAHSPRRHTHQAEEEAMNEFVDEDLDERVDDIAEETAMKVGYGRYLHYVYKILSTRLFLGHIEKVADNEGSQRSKNSLELLPIPLASINITEQLGAITMVCFVDDDIISENYSVTEEIFLLSENIEKENESSGNKLQPGSDYKSYKSSTTTTAPNGDGFGSVSGVPFNSGKGSYTKGTVLDLHANPEATGSRFENPLWWKFLPCLKPLGMNALLTYQHTAENLQNPSTASIDLSTGMNGGPFGLNMGIGASLSGRMKSFNTSFSIAPNVTATVTGNPLIETQSNNNPRDAKPVSSTSSIIDIERGLVRHIRKTMPLEFLRELAEEIGFLSDDLQNFQKAIEVNVIAPGLQNAHLLEDNHVWGQDETRRRGSLLPTLRGGVYRDVRSGGGLQMMSLGDPSLVLNYCKEYWDGNTRSITPLSAADRAEVLAVFDRWRLEDFDVVAFSYSPMPVAPLLYFTSEQGLDQNLSSRKSFMSVNNAPTVAGNAANLQNTTEVKAPAIFFVDPSKPHELMGGKARRKSVIAASNPAVKSGTHGEQTDGRYVRLKERPETIPEEDTKIRESSGSAGGDGILKSSKSGSHPGLIELKIEPRLTVSEKIITNTTKQLHLSPVTPREKLDEIDEEIEGSPLTRQETVTEILPLTYDNLHHQDEVIPIDTSGLEEEENAFIRSKTVPTYAMKSTSVHQKLSSPTKIPKSISGDVNDLHNRPNAMTASDRGESQSFMGESWDDSIQASLENIDSHLPPHLRNVAASVAGSAINDNFSEKIAKLRNRGLRKSLSDSNLAVKALAGSRVHGDDDLLMQRDDSSLLFSPMPYDESEKKFTFERTTSLGLSLGAPPSPNPSSASHTPVNSMPNSPVNLSRVNSRSAKKFEGDLEDDETDSVHNVLHRAGSGKKKGFSQLPTVPPDRAKEDDDIQHRSPSVTLKPQPNVHQQMINRSAGKKDRELTKGVSLESVRSGYKYQALSSDLEDMSIDMQESQSRSQSYSRSMYVKPLSHHPFTAAKEQLEASEEFPIEVFEENGEGRNLIKKVETMESYGGAEAIDLENIDAIINQDQPSSVEGDDLSLLSSTTPLMKSLSLNEGLDVINPLSSQNSSDHNQSRRSNHHNQEQDLLLQHLEEEKAVVAAKKLIQDSLIPTRQRSKTFTPDHHVTNEEADFLLPNPVDLELLPSSLDLGNAVTQQPSPKLKAKSISSPKQLQSSSSASMLHKDTFDADQIPPLLSVSRKRSATSSVKLTRASISTTQLNADPTLQASATIPSDTGIGPGGRRAAKAFRASVASASSRHLTTQQQQQQQRNHAIMKQRRREALRQLWSLMRQQIFLGMVASSVPVRRDVTQTKEDLDVAGIRFVYFSAQNMKRSKPVAEKIGIPFDWNCAISLRCLDTDKPDPHRHISHYADWDVLARMPHGIEAIRHHIQHVDNVPLLVSLFTDATPDTIQQMIEIFRENGETVLAIGSGYRSYNQNIYSAANLATSVAVLPNVRSFLPAYERDVYDLFPVFSDQSLTKADLKLSFDLVGLGTINLLQAKCFYNDIIIHRSDWMQRFDESLIDHLKLPILLETIRKGRVLLLNEFQCIGLYVLSVLALSLWQCIAFALPISIPPICPPSMLMVFVAIYLPVMMLVMVFTDDHEGIMKTTPRKTNLQRRWRDESRFYYYLFTRVAFMVFNIWATGYITTISVFRQSERDSDDFYESASRFHHLLENNNTTTSQIEDLRIFWLIQDMMTHAAFLSIIAHSFSLLVRGQQLWKGFPLPWNYPAYYITIALLLVLHTIISLFRALFRSCTFSGEAAMYFTGINCSDVQSGSETYEYSDLHYSVWIVLVVLTVLNGWIGFYLNKDDNHHYRRYLQFLRLEFDTRLGMHSPR